MKLYGVDNVRGSLFTKPFDLSYYEKIMAGQLYCELNNLCRKCDILDILYQNVIMIMYQIVKI